MEIECVSLVAYFNRIDHGLPIHYFKSEHHALITLNLREETLANFTNLKYFGEGLIPRNVTVGVVCENLFTRKFILAEIAKMFFLFFLSFFSLLFMVVELLLIFVVQKL